jgi:hypothetical protein
VQARPEIMARAIVGSSRAAAARVHRAEPGVRRSAKWHKEARTLKDALIAAFLRGENTGPLTLKLQDMLEREKPK